ncbi:36720_t:CDS:2, partial [Gigaspora margarita]
PDSYGFQYCGASTTFEPLLCGTAKSTYFYITLNEGNFSADEVYELVYK